uniref:Uncharacterized protein n=1 Tax=Rhizophora mucronata TaxID=61149 RepID=A0A2P2NVQ2_RHIMU
MINFDLQPMRWMSGESSWPTALTSMSMMGRLCEEL